MNQAATNNTPDWNFAAYQSHQNALQTVWDEARQDNEIAGVLICGSVARGDALPGSDLDVRLLLVPDAAPRPFDARTSADVWVECTYLTVEGARARLETRSMECFPYREGRILRDDSGTLALLKTRAQHLWESYTAPADEKRESLYWLQATERKMRAAGEAGQWEKAAYLAATGAWPLLTGLFLAANRPLPPSGAVLAHLTDASHRVGLPADVVRDVWAAQSREGRLYATLTVLTAILPRLAE